MYDYLTRKADYLVAMVADSQNKGVLDARVYFKDRPRRRELPLRANLPEPQPVVPEPVIEISPEVIEVEVIEPDEKGTRPVSTPSGDQMKTTEVAVVEVSSFGNGEFDAPIIIDGDSFRILAPQLSQSMGHRDAYDMLRNIPEDEKGYAKVHTPGGIQSVSYVTEAGFYRVIGQRQVTRIPDEEVRDKVMRFQRWMFGEVIPQIQRTNTYVADKRNDVPAEQQTTSPSRIEKLQETSLLVDIMLKFKGLIHPDHLEAEARIVLAQAMGKLPELESGKRPL